MTDYNDLLAGIEKKLGEYEYFNDIAISIPNVIQIMYLKNKTIFKVKNLCAVIDMPENIVDQSTAKRFFGFLKGSLLDKYGDAFLWKELEMCFVVFCHDELFKMLKADESLIMSQASFSLSALMGTCLINKETFENEYQSSWGLYFSGDHLKSVNEVVQKWCEIKKAA